MLKLILFVFPLGFDTFAVSAALGVQGLTAKDRLKASLLMSSFEMGMPVAGLLLGDGLGSAIGGVADYIAALALGVLGLWMLVVDDDDERKQLGAFARLSGFALLGLGISISLDELAMGFTIGLLRLPIVWAVILIGAQAFVVAQIGLRLGARLGKASREWAERFAGLALVGLALLVVVEKAFR